MIIEHQTKLLKTNKIEEFNKNRNLRLRFTTLSCFTINDLEHVNLSMQIIEVEGLQIETHPCLLSKVGRQTKTTLVIYFHETKEIEAPRLSNQKSKLKP